MPSCGQDEQLAVLSPDINLAVGDESGSPNVTLGIVDPLDLAGVSIEAVEEVATLTAVSDQLATFAVRGPTTMTPERAYALAFVEAVQMYPFNDIPFPGITGRDPWLPHGNNWRFCGSTHVWPVKWLEAIHKSYCYNLRHFVHEYDCVPLDLAIWPLVEHSSGLPFKWYRAEYDNTQLRNFPCAL